MGYEKADAINRKWSKDSYNGRGRDPIIDEQWRTLTKPEA